MENNVVAVLLSTVAFLLAAIPGIVWVSHIRAARRFAAAVDAYAKREMERERRRNGPRRVVLPSSCRDSSPF
jgi:hypothetical protein